MRASDESPRDEVFKGVTAEFTSGGFTAELPTLPYPQDYDVTESIDGVPAFDYTITMPAGDYGVKLGAARPSRTGGPSHEDLVFRDRLYSSIGRITVASGHVEMALKRLITSFTSRDFNVESVRDMWDALEKRLKRACDSDSPEHTRIRAAIAAAQTERLRLRRNDVVHGYWWIYDIGHARNARFPHKGESHLLPYKLSAVAELGQEIARYAHELDSVIPDDSWPAIKLPAPHQARAFRFIDGPTDSPPHSMAELDPQQEPAQDE